MQRGFTAIEMLVSVAIIAFLAAFTVTSLRDYTQRQRFSAESSEIERTLAEQRTRSQASIDDVVHGIRFATTSIVRFQGPNAATSTASSTISFSVASIQTALTGNTKEITFNKLSGIPSATGTIDIYNASLQTTTTITVYASGLIQISE